MRDYWNSGTEEGLKASLFAGMRLIVGYDVSPNPRRAG